MRQLVLLCCAALLCCAGLLNAKDGPVDFSGSWTLDQSKSELGDTGGGRRGGMVAPKLTVTQQEGKLTVATVRRGRDGGETPVTLVYTLDGKESRNGSENRSTVSVAKWSEDGKSLTIDSEATFSREGQQFTMKSTEVWVLVDGALVIEAVRTTARGDFTTRAVYTR